MATDLNYGKPPIPSMGPYLFSGDFIRRMFSRVFQGGLSFQDTITATAGGTKAAAFALLRSHNRISVCATGGDSVLLPAAIQGSRVVVRNDGAASCNIFAKGADTINGASAATASALAAAKATEFACFTAGAWYTLSVQA